MHALLMHQAPWPQSELYVQLVGATVPPPVPLDVPPPLLALPPPVPLEEPPPLLAVPPPVPLEAPPVPLDVPPPVPALPPPVPDDVPPSLPFVPVPPQKLPWQVSPALQSWSCVQGRVQ